MPEDRDFRPTGEDLLAQRPWVRALARAVAADAAGADELEQETLLRALESPPPRGLSRAWLGTVLRNLFRRGHRTVERVGRRERAAARPEATEPVVDIVARAEAHRRLVAAVMELPEPGRAAVLLRFFEGLPPGAVAARTGVPVETARTRIRRAVGALRDRLEREGRGGGGLVLLAPLLDRGKAAPAAATGGVLVGTTAKIVLGAAAAAAAGVVGLTLLGDDGGGEPAPTVAAVPERPPRDPGSSLAGGTDAVTGSKPPPPVARPAPSPDPDPDPAPDTATLLLDRVAWGRVTVDLGLRELARRAERDLAYEDAVLRRLCETTPLDALDLQRVGWEECIALVERHAENLVEGKLLAHTVEPRRLVVRLEDPAMDPGDSARIEARKKRLREERTSCRFTGQTLTEAFSYLSARHRLNIVMEESTARKRCDQVRVHLALTDVTLAEAVRTLVELDPDLRLVHRPEIVLIR